MHEIHAGTLDFIRTNIELQQRAKSRAHGVEEEMEKNISELETSLNQVSVVTKQGGNMDTFKYIVSVKKTASEGAEEAKNEDGSIYITRGLGQECKIERKTIAICLEVLKEDNEE